MNPVTISHGNLKTICIKLLQAASIERPDAEITADVITFAELRGISSHGISRLPNYLKRISLGLINAKPQIRYLQTKGATVLIDGDNGLGQVIAARAMEKAVKIARKNGVSLVGVRKSNHFGVTAYFAMQALKSDMIGFVLTNSSPAMAPYGGIKPLIGTNPMAIAVPGKEGASIVIDMSSSVAARGKIRQYAEKGGEIPPDWALDETGKPTTNPEQALKGSLLPMGGVKGYALAILIDLLAGILSGAGYSEEVRALNDFTGPVNAGHLLGAINIESFMDVEQFKEKVFHYIKMMHESPKAVNTENIYVPGEIEQQLTLERLQRGIPLTGIQIDILKKLAHSYNLEIPGIEN